MWKIVVAFLVFGGLALLMLSKGGDIDMSGEKHGSEATHAPEHVVSAPAATASVASAPVAPASAVASAPVASASK